MDTIINILILKKWRGVVYLLIISNPNYGIMFINFSYNLWQLKRNKCVSILFLWPKRNVWCIPVALRIIYHNDFGRQEGQTAVKIPLSCILFVCGFCHLSSYAWITNDIDINFIGEKDFPTLFCIRIKRKFCWNQYDARKVF